MSELFATPLAKAIAIALFEFLWQGAAIGVAAALVLLALRRRTAQIRYVVACTGLLLMAVAPIAATLRTLADEPTRPLTIAAVSGQPATSTVDAIVAPAVTAAPFSREWLEARAPYVLAIWSAGVLLLALQLLIGWLRIERIRRRATPLQADRWMTTIQSLAAHLGVTRPLRVVQSALVDVPAVIGWIRPVIFVPISALAGLSPQYVEALLAHELAHIRRADYLVNVIQSGVETLLFYHPAVWWLSRQIRIERELCCDDLAAATCDDRVTYAEALASLEELRSATPALAMAADGGELIARIRRLLEPGSADGPRLTNLRGFAMGMVVIVLLLAVNGETTGRAIGAAHPAVPVSVPMATIAPAPLPATPPRVQPDQTQAPPAPTPQTQTGISGRVFDGTGGAIPGATITVSSPAMGRSYQTVTNAAGRFTVPTLDAGAYRVTASISGFKSARVDNVLVTPPGLTMIAIRLELGTLSETVMITAPGVGAAITQPSARPGSEYFDLAKAYYEQGRYGEAEQAMARALEMVRAAAVPQPPVFEPPPAPPQPNDPNRPSVPIRVGGDIREPRKVKDVKPIYPADALAAQVSGVVILEATVAKDGTVRDVRVLRSIPMLDAAAIDAVQQWQYTPTLLNGVPVEVLMTVTVNFAAR